MTNEIVSIEKRAADFLRGLESTLPTYAIRDYHGEIFIKSAMMAIISNPDLQECLTTPEGSASMVNALRMAAGTGLSLNPQEGKAALTTFGKKVGSKWFKTASYQVMKNGLIELSLDSGKVDVVAAETIRENDDFRMLKTPSGDSYEFSPARKDRGAIDGFLAVVLMKDGRVHCQYMTVTQAEEHREKYAKNLRDEKGNPKEGHAWFKSFEGMGQKTILKKLLNSTHISREVDHAIGSDWEPEVKDVTPAPKGVSADDLAEKLEHQPELEPRPVETAPVDPAPVPEQGEESKPGSEQPETTEEPVI